MNTVTQKQESIEKAIETLGEWRLLPIQATSEMMTAATNTDRDLDIPGHVWKAMSAHVPCTDHILSKELIPNGWFLGPYQATPEMMNAGTDRDPDLDLPGAVWKEMYKQAPQFEWDPEISKKPRVK